MSPFLPSVDDLLRTLANSLRSRLARRGIDAPLLLGIQTGGVLVAEQLLAMLQVDAPIGTLDISFHRDDFGSAELHPVVRPTDLPWDVNNRDVVLVDDVLYTGRTVRAALNEIFDWGRPKSVTLAVLIARDGRELPIEADAMGTEIALESGQQIKLRGPSPLWLELRDAR
jgi:pyrimidine operon attenuation protein / uracil phosphoribosyltransferase